jgi:FixJ family two-component response regulator
LSNRPLIAIVDDDDAVREALFDLLQVEGLAARTFESGEALLADAAADGFDCVISDVRMAEIDGLELQQRLRARGCSMPVIFITSSVEDTTRTQALSDGAAAWFTKPVADEELLHALRAALDAPRGD